MSHPDPNLNPPVPMPEEVGPYRIERELGSGGMGTVYLGYHRETNEPAAIKVLPESMAREPGFLARFNREIDAMHKLKSPHIVQLYDSGVEDGTYYYAMEYVPGETLTDRLTREKRIPWRDAIAIAVQVCLALKAAHNCGIVHRDLKPSNLLLDEDGTVKLSDFGVAQVFATSRLTVTGGILGTAEYMSPEQAQGKRATKKSDLYSLGAVLYVMLTGRPPFTGKTTLDIVQKHRFSQFDSPKRIVPEIPFWLDVIVCKCLAKKPDERYPDAYVLMLRLQEVPQKVDLQLAGEEKDDSSPTSETQAADLRSEHIDVPVEASGTLVRDLFRAQLESEKLERTWARVFDNTWVLIGLLILLLGGGYLLMRWNHLTPEERFAKGVALMERPAGPGWEMARHEYFLPLLEDDPDVWGPRVAPYLDQIELYDLKKQILGRNWSSRRTNLSDPEAVIRQAVELRRLGQTGLARQKLQALLTLLEGNPDLVPLRELAKSLDEDIAGEISPGRLDFVKRSLDRAQSLDQAGKSAQAQAIWRSVVELYDADPDARPLVERARRQLESSASDWPETNSNTPARRE